MVHKKEIAPQRECAKEKATVFQREFDSLLLFPAKHLQAIEIPRAQSSQHSEAVL
jgi:hypothetical protein